MQKNTVYFLIAILGMALFFPFLGQVHLFDWDEINFAECAREMIVSKDYLRAQIDFAPFWEKPPLFIWLQLLSMKLFGINEYAARFPNAMVGVLTLLTLYYAGKRILNNHLALWWVLLYAASWLPHFYFKSGIIDPSFNFFIFLGFFQFYLISLNHKRHLHALLAGLFIGLAVLTKGPVAILVAMLAFVVHVILNKGWGGYKFTDLLLIALSALIPVALWFGADIILYGWTYAKWFLTEFIVYQVRLFRTEDADHGGPFFYHFIVLLIGCFPASVLLFQYIGKSTKQHTAKAFTRWMWIMFWVVLILFSIVKTKIVHYSSLCYFPLTYLAALQVYKMLHEGMLIKKWVKGLFIFITILWGILLTALPLVGIYKNSITKYIDDPFAVGNLQADVHWSYMECLIGVLYMVTLVIVILRLNRHFRQSMVAFVVIQLVFIQITVLHITPKIEAYSQRSAIQFFQNFIGKDVYVCVLGYRSYAHLFYTQKQPSTNPHYHSKNFNYPDENWLLTGTLDKPAYFICKIQNAPKYDTMMQLQSLGNKNGFAFYKRKD
jgi:4-amino-4-deoxy-L-arabinose transferase-like glycosyltransferase